MVNIVKFAQFYCIYLLSSAQMSALEMQFHCFYKKTIPSVVILPDEIRILYTICIFHSEHREVRENGRDSGRSLMKYSWIACPFVSDGNT